MVLPWRAGRGGGGAWVPSLVRELKSHMPCGTGEGKKGRERKKEKEGKEGGRKMDSLLQGTSRWQDAGEKRVQHGCRNTNIMP